MKLPPYDSRPNDDVFPMGALVEWYGPEITLRNERLSMRMQKGSLWRIYQEISFLGRIESYPEPNIVFNGIASARAFMRAFCPLKSLAEQAE